MTEPTIICPNCKTEIKLTESLAGPLLEATRREFERRLALKESDISMREVALQALRARTYPKVPYDHLRLGREEPLTERHRAQRNVPRFTLIQED